MINLLFMREIDGWNAFSSASLSLHGGRSSVSRWLADQGYDKLHFELPLQEIEADGSETNAILDCLAEGPRGLLIIDHKSGSCPDPAARFASYQPQLTTYTAMVRRRWPDRPLNGAAILWMSEGTLSIADASLKETA